MKFLVTDPVTPCSKVFIITRFLEVSVQTTTFPFSSKSILASCNLECYWNHSYSSSHWSLVAESPIAIHQIRFAIVWLLWVPRNMDMLFLMRLFSTISWTCQLNSTDRISMNSSESISIRLLLASPITNSTHSWKTEFTECLQVDIDQSSFSEKLWFPKFPFLFCYCISKIDPW